MLVVIIDAHNEAAVLAISLDALFAETHVPGPTMIADDGSTDSAEALLTQHNRLDWTGQ
jgi:glycosyltransferase involved in cell wall biosynthesis